MTAETNQVEVPESDEKVPAYSWYALSILVIVYVLNFVDRNTVSYTHLTLPTIYSV